MKIPNKQVKLFKSYRHYSTCSVLVPVTEIPNGTFLCNNIGKMYQIKIEKSRFLEGEFILMPEIPKTVRYISFDHYEKNGCIVIFNDGNALFWNGMLKEGDNTCYETYVSPALMKENFEFFKPLNYFTNFSQLFGILEKWGIKMRDAKAHNYTIDDVNNTIKTGELKPFISGQKNVQYPTHENTGKTLIINGQCTVNEPAKNIQLSLF